LNRVAAMIERRVPKIARLKRVLTLGITPVCFRQAGIKAVSLLSSASPPAFDPC
jgi:hypothetical protein